jgi:hypothetical protein
VLGKRYFIYNPDAGPHYRLYNSAARRDNARRQYESGMKPWTARLHGQAGTAHREGNSGFYANFRFDDEPEPEPEPEPEDYRQKYERLVEALYAEAQRRNWCGEWDDFAEKHGIEKPKPELPEEPPVGSVVKFRNRVPFVRDEARGWIVPQTGRELGSWRQALEHISGPNQPLDAPFEVLYQPGVRR